MSFRLKGSIAYLISLALVAVYFIFCGVVYENGSFAVTKIVSPFFRETHSGSYYSQEAERLEYAPHAPGEIDRLFKLSMIRSPADWKVFMSYFQYLQSRDCCMEQASRVIEEASRRNPASTRPNATAITFFLSKGQKEKAFPYFRKGLELNQGSLSKLFSLLVNQDLSAEDLIRIVPRNSEGLTFLAAYLARKGPSEKEEWYRTIQELHSKGTEPSRALQTALQAFSLGEIDVARRYAEIAGEYPQTRARAKKLLASIDRHKHSR